MDELTPLTSVWGWVVLLTCIWSSLCCKFSLTNKLASVVGLQLENLMKLFGKKREMYIFQCQEQEKDYSDIKDSALTDMG